MRHFVVVLTAILWAMPVQAETKEAPDGFGPIKFGMTKEEALSVLDGRGRVEEGEIHFEQDTHLTSDPQRIASLTVELTLTDIGIGSILVRNPGFQALEYECVSLGQAVAARVSSKYKKNPLFSGVWREEDNRNFNAIYTFGFDNNVVIEVHVLYHPKTFEALTSIYGENYDIGMRECLLFVIYSPLASPPLF